MENALNDFALRRSQKLARFAADPVVTCQSEWRARVVIDSHQGDQSGAQRSAIKEHSERQTQKYARNVTADFIDANASQNAQQMPMLIAVENAHLRRGRNEKGCGKQSDISWISLNGKSIANLQDYSGRVVIRYKEK